MKAAWIVVKINLFKRGKFAFKMSDKFTELHLSYPVGISNIVAASIVP